MSRIGRKIGSGGSLLDEIYAPTISGSDDLADQMKYRNQNRGSLGGR
jgi:hypothetical protein